MSITILVYALLAAWAVVALCALVLTDTGARRQARSPSRSGARHARVASAVPLRLRHTQHR
jgi:hypothetical protein